jgi:H+/Cl- antiporter ClcA
MSVSLHTARLKSNWKFLIVKKLVSAPAAIRSGVWLGRLGIH